MNPLRVISCREVRVSCSFYNHIFLCSYFFAVSLTEYEWILSRSFWLIDGSQTVTTTSSQSEPWSNGNEGLIKDSLDLQNLNLTIKYKLVSHTRHSFWDLISLWGIKISKVKLATVVEGNQKAPFSISMTLKCRGGRNSFPWITPLYPLYVPYIAEC